MVLNTAKTKVMLITTRQKRVHITKEDMTLTYNHEILNDISEDKILGVQVDDHLLFSYHIDKTAKITSNIWLLSRIKDFKIKNIGFNSINHSFSHILITEILFGEPQRKVTYLDCLGFRKELVK